MSDEEEFTPRLKCDVELELTGPNDSTINKWAAEALRGLADRLERGELQGGFTDLTDHSGKKIGEVYADFSQGTF